MNFINKFWLKYSRTGENDALFTMTVLAVFACIIKFLFDGDTFSVLGHAVIIGHMEPASYATFLTPILGAHAAKEWKVAIARPLTDGDSENDPPTLK